MEPLNPKRFVLAGLAAGLLINIFDGALYTVVIGAEANAIMERLGLELPGTAGMALYAALAFLVGFVAVWLYTGMRARLGPGPVTAAKTGVAVWAIAYLTPFLDLTIEGLYTQRMFWLAAAFTLVSVPLATMGGAWVYRGPGGEDPAPEGDRAPADHTARAGDAARADHPTGAGSS